MLSLANLATAGYEEMNRIVENKGLSALETAQCSENMRLRQAATEVFCNLSGHEAVAEFLAVPNRAKLWCALVEDCDEV